MPTRSQTKTKITLSETEQAQIELIHEIYQDFRMQLNKLEKKQNSVINQVLQRIDHSATEHILNQLNKS